MRALNTPLAAFCPSYVCRGCASSLRRATHRPVPARLSSSLAASKPVNFSWYFFHNDRWTRSPPQRRSLSAEPPPPIAQTQALSLDGTAYPPARSYRASEPLTARRLLTVYSQLSKSRLTALIVLSAMAGVALSPLPTTVPVLLSTALGTTLCCASANALNQLQEVPFDAQMARTRMRPLVRRAISPVHAAGFALATGVTGPVVLWTMVNPTTALLGAANIALYAGAYTWLKRKSILNTWVGAVVGGIPPLMGWTACEGALLPSSAHPVEFFLPSFLSSAPLDSMLHLTGDNPLAPLALFALLFSWQFPHFNALSHVVREAYAQAGYRMLCVLDPAKNALVALRHAGLLAGICAVLVPLSGLTTWTFGLLSLAPNAVCLVAAWRFWKSGSEKHARRVFQHSLWYLPVMLGLMMFCKRGLDWSSWIGTQAEEQKQEEQSSPASAGLQPA
ncbi:protoheme IX farnesyltransferase [Wolfiporia cocos MD-104 SS10]|uniref:Protoheme IX farnesyltransferase, mitochondrial n=1 Tax=Wolfiporia cocos (strain MD-104) TaxID=742152 RepID=A0A2H3JKB1_WOLCO|nr:protoheme IX farnesyltransferase [Wolfiporia cocos MD-104 SS10]